MRALSRPLPLVFALAAAVTSSTGCLRFAAQAAPDGAPLAKVAAANVEAHGGDVVTLDGTASTDPDGDPIAFAWSSDTVAVADADTATASVVAPLAAGHTFVSLVVSDGAVASEPATVDIHVNAAPVASIDGPASTPNGAAAALHGAGDDEPGTALTFAWRVVDAPAGSACVVDGGGGPCLDAADAADVAFTPDVKGAFAVELVVDDGDLASGPARIDITSENRAPVAAATSSAAIAGTPVHSGDVIALDGTGSTDPDGDALTFSWTVSSAPAAGTASLAQPGAESTDFSAVGTGAYVVELTVTDVDGASDSVTVPVSLENSPPSFTAGPSAASTVAGAPVSLLVSASDVDGDAVTFHWSLVHAPGAATAVLADVDSAALRFTPSTRTPAAFLSDCDARPDECFIVRVTASDGIIENAAEAFVIATDRAPVLTSITPSPLVAVAEAPSALAAAAGDADGDALSFSWRVTEAVDAAGGGAGGGAAACLASPAACLTGATTATPLFTAPVAGTYLVEVTVDDGTATATATVAVTASAAPPPPPPPNRDPVVSVQSPVAGVVNAGVALSATATDADGDRVAFSWRVTGAPAGAGSDACLGPSGAGTACLSGADTATPIFTPAATGAFAVTVTAIDVDVDGVARGGSDSASVVVNVAAEPPPPNVPPTVSATSPVDAVAGTGVALVATANDVDGDTVAFSWHVTGADAAGAACLGPAGAGTACLAGATTSTPLFTAPSAGTFIVAVDVLDFDGSGAPRGGSASASVVVNATAPVPPANVPPVAVAAVDRSTITSGDTVLLDGTGSSDPDAAGGGGSSGIASFAWDVVTAPAGGIATFSPLAADVAAPSLTLRGRGVWTVQLVVTDADGAASAPDTVRIGVDNAPPVITLVTADGVDAAPGVARANGTSIALQAFASDLDPQDGGGGGAGASTLTFAWRLVDTPAGGGGLLVGATSDAPTFTPTEKTAVTDPAACTLGACYVLALTVSDGIDSDSTTVVVTSANRAPVANAGPDQPSAGEIVVLDGTGSADPDGDALDAARFTWRQTDGADVTGGAGSLSGAIVSFNVAAEGAFAFALTVSDGTATSAPDSVVVIVPHVDRPPTVSIADANVTAISGASFGLHVDVVDPDLDNTSVAWTRTSGDATLFPATLSGADPALTAPSLLQLFASSVAAGGDNRAVYSVIATDPDGKSSAPLTVNLFVLPGADHIVIDAANANGGNDAACGTVAHPCLTFAAGLGLAAAQAKDVVAVGGAFVEDLDPATSLGGVSTLDVERSVWGGRDATLFTRAAPSAVTCVNASAGAADVTCATTAAGAGVVIDNTSFALADGDNQVALHCVACAATFSDVDVAAGAGTSSGGPASATALLVDGTATPVFTRVSATATGSCDPVGVSVGAGSDVGAAALLVDVDFTRGDCVANTASAVRVRGGAFSASLADMALATSASLVSAALDVDADGSVELIDSRVRVAGGDGLSIVNGSAVLTRSTLASTSGVDGAGLRSQPAPANSAALVELTAVTGFAQAAVFDDDGAGYSFVTSALSGASTCNTVPFDPSTCAADGLSDALARSCSFTSDFHLVDTPLNQCIDAADAGTTTALDLDGDPRPDASGRLDVGFDEL